MRTIYSPQNSRRRCKFGRSCRPSRGNPSRRWPPAAPPTAPCLQDSCCFSCQFLAFNIHRGGLDFTRARRLASCYSASRCIGAPAAARPMRPSSLLMSEKCRAGKRGRLENEAPSSHGRGSLTARLSGQPAARLALWCLLGWDDAADWETNQLWRCGASRLPTSSGCI